MIIELNNIVSNSSSNTEGLKLFDLLDSEFQNHGEIIIEIDNFSSLSSSFLNSSIGLFLEKYGVEAFKSKVKIRGAKHQFIRVKDYLNKFSSLITEGN